MSRACTHLFLDHHFILEDCSRKRISLFLVSFLLQCLGFVCFFYLSSYRSSCLLVKTTTLELSSFLTAAQFSSNRTGSFPGRSSHRQFPEWPCQYIQPLILWTGFLAGWWHRVWHSGTPFLLSYSSGISTKREGEWGEGNQNHASWSCAGSRQVQFLAWVGWCLLSTFTFSSLVVLFCPQPA